MKKLLLYLLIISLLSSSCISIFQRKTKYNNEGKVLETTFYEINDKTASLFSGEAIDIETNEKLGYLNVEIKSTLITYTNSADSIGCFLFKNKIPGTYQVRFSYLGYKPLTIDSINIENGKAINIRVGLKKTGMIFAD